MTTFIYLTSPVPRLGLAQRPVVSHTPINTGNVKSLAKYPTGTYGAGRDVLTDWEVTNILERAMMEVRSNHYFGFAPSELIDIQRFYAKIV